ncbi:uncharacterized protein SPAPADRAFT_54102 [Spathaspora passalidarum NRRL Y-27907]|uniref:Protein kinase domain-containing protein n=1 Tax=Spathaspora passalidarum (strain NRRL Y-27907 / 11-Y1) TaxID=619300 RepID=G3AJ61_SPAPN|nr:uncharacterized protein SPAPADRAFT_54102 [Spathaspora passalidarum NRRL Y-27907]EGW33818.1 hypothetical protein SPAPADRAFT_54102 [Spathaspora passalidarum NRRL Y-27907]
MNHTPPATFLKREFTDDHHNNTSSTSSYKITGVYELDFPENKRAATLRSKLSAHIGSPAQTRTGDASFSTCSSNSTNVSSKSTAVSTVRSLPRKRKSRSFGLNLGLPGRASDQPPPSQQQQQHQESDQERHEHNDRLSVKEETLKQETSIKHEKIGSPILLKHEHVGSPAEQENFRYDFEERKKFMFPNVLTSDTIENKENKEFAFKDISSRPALAEIPVNIDTFRKPKLPKPIHSTESHISPKRIISINGKQYEKLELLGRGGTSKVYRVKSLSNNQIYAIKKVSNGQYDEISLAGFKGEIDLLLKLKHSDRVVRLIDHAITEGSIYLVMERGEIDLAQVLNNKLRSQTPFDLDFIRFHSLEMLRCVRAVHDAGIVHSDLKPANFLIVKGILKIIDFGIANAVPDHTVNVYRESQIGTPNYMAPEALTEVNHSMPRNTWRVGKPSDIWSIGCIIYQLIYGRPPYAGYSGTQRMMAIINPQVKIQYPATGVNGGVVPESAIELMKMCLKREPHERWTVEECLRCDFLRPKVVNRKLVQDMVHEIMDYGHNRRINNEAIGSDEYDDMVELVMEKITHLNYS